MSVTVRPYRRGGWEVDITTRLPSGQRHRERCKAPVSSKSAAQRWGEDRERHLVQHGRARRHEEVPTLEGFVPTFLDYARGNRQKPSSVTSKETIARVHLIPLFGDRRLDTIKTADIERLKQQLETKAPKTVNNVLTVLSGMFKAAVGAGVIERAPCAVRLVPVATTSSDFHDFDAYERLVDAASRIGPQTLAIILLGGDAGLRAGEMVALHWADVDFVSGQLTIRRSEWNGQITSPKSGRVRHVPMTERLARALRSIRHLRSPRVICRADGSSLRRQNIQKRVRRAARHASVANIGVHVLRHTFCSHLAMRGAPARAIQQLAGHKDLSTTERYMHLTPSALTAAIRLLDVGRTSQIRGDIVETAAGSERNASS